MCADVQENRVDDVKKVDEAVKSLPSGDTVGMQGYKFIG